LGAWVWRARSVGGSSHTLDPPRCEGGHMSGAPSPEAGDAPMPWANGTLDRWSSTAIPARTVIPQLARNLTSRLDVCSTASANAVASRRVTARWGRRARLGGLLRTLGRRLATTVAVVARRGSTRGASTELTR